MNKKTTNYSLLTTRSRKGSALLVTIMIMGILLLLTLGLSRLIIGDMRSTVDTIAAGKAYYAAEAGIESALLELHQNLPGYENEKGERIINKDQEIKSEYSISNQTQVYPWRDPEDFGSKTVQPKEFYATLSLNESVTIPLFIVDKDGNTQNVEDFRVEYYVGYKSGDLKGQGLGNKITQDDVDVLRWKVFGITNTGTDRQTEAISDYFPVLIKSNAQNPMCLGTSSAIQKDLNVEGNIKTTCANKEIVSASYAREHYENKGDQTIYYAKDPIGFEQFTKNYKRPNDTDTATIDPNLTDPTNPTATFAEPVTPTLDPNFQLQDPTKKTINQDPDTPQGTGLGYPIEEFMKGHDNKYLTLTNIINPAAIQADSDSVRKAISNIHYRIVIFPSGNGDKKTVREFATIRANGTYQNIKKSIEARIKMDQFLPVFNFSLYRTETEKEIQ